MFSSKYNYYYESQIFNTRQKSHIVLPVELVSKIKTNDFSVIPDSLLEILKIMGMVLEDNIDEKKLTRFWFFQKNLSPEVGIIFLPTYACNCKCIYCFEDGLRQPPTKSLMNPSEFQGKFLTWVAELIKAIQPQYLDFAFHGGKPLLATKFLWEIGEGVNKLADLNNAKKLFSIVTNGTLLNKNNISELLRVNVRKALITLDGPQIIHDRRRSFKNGRGTYDLILKNMKMALNMGMEVNLGINFDKMNFEQIPSLFSILCDEGFSHFENFNIIFGAVKRGLTQSKPEHFMENEMNMDETAKCAISLYRLALDYGLPIVDPVAIGLCTMRKSWVFMVDCEGKVFKCITMVGRKESYVGNISEPIELLFQRVSQFSMLIPWETNQQCEDCIYMPLCLGGCSEQSLVNKGNISEVDCQKGYYDYFLPNSLDLRQRRLKHLSIER